MRLQQSLYWLLAFITTINALALPTSFGQFIDSSRELYKRKGGGGGGGRSGGSSSSSSSGGSSSSSGSSSSGGSSSGSGSRGSSGLTSTTSNTGGRTPGGSGPAPSYGRGGAYYAGGASVPYSAGAASRRGYVPPLLIGGALIFPALWVYGAYAYPYGSPWTYRNTTTNRNMTLPVQCYCAARASCGCDGENTDVDYIQAVANNRSIAQVVNINGTQTLFINGTLPNGTTAAGGDEGAAFKQTIMQASGWWIVVAGVTYTMWFM